MKKPKAFSAVLALSLASFCFCSAQAQKAVLDTFTVVQGSSPCSAITVNIFDGSRNAMKLILFWSGKTKVLQGNLNSFAAGKTYSIQSTCVSSRGFTQGGSLNYVANGKPIIANFIDGGFTLKQGK